MESLQEALRGHDVEALRTALAKAKDLPEELSRRAEDRLLALLHRKKQQTPFDVWRLADAVGVWAPLLRHEVPFRHAELVELHRAIASNGLAGKRIGKDWMPSDSLMIRKRDSDDSWAEYADKEPLNSACTKWCSDHYFPDAFARFSTIANFMRFFDALATDTKLLFKGGVMIRIVLLEFLKHFPPEGRAAVTKELNAHKALSLSDFDFEVVSERDQTDADVHRSVLSNYAAVLNFMRIMQAEMRRESSRAMMHLRWDADGGARELLKRLQTVVDEVDASSPFFKARVDRVVLGDTDPSPPSGYRTRGGLPTPAARQNVLIFDCEGADRCVWPATEAWRAFGMTFDEEPGEKHLYATLNTYIGEEEAQSRSTRRAGFVPSVFHLARIKHAFIVYYTTGNGERRCDRLGGEMIDVSQSHTLRGANPTLYAEYPILGMDVRKVQVRSYSVRGFFKEQLQVVMEGANEPWRIAKKEKRLHRCVGFLFAYTFSPSVEGTHEAKRLAMKRLVECLGSPAALAAASPRTGIAPVDAFAEAQRQALRGSKDATPVELDAYVATLRRACQVFLRGMETANGEPFLIVSTADTLLAQLMFN